MHDGDGAGRHLLPLWLIRRKQAQEPLLFMALGPVPVPVDVPVPARVLIGANHRPAPYRLDRRYRCLPVSRAEPSRVEQCHAQ